MTTRTEADLVNQALRVLGIIAAGQGAEAEDFTAMDGYVQPTFDQLSARDIVTVDDNDEIPSEWFLPLAILVADAAANEFGLPGVPPSDANPNPVLKAETTLREAVYARPTGESQRSEYF